MINTCILNKGIDFLVTVNSDEEAETNIEVKRENVEMSSDMEQKTIESDDMNDFIVKDEDDQEDDDDAEEQMQSDTETRTAIATIEENENCDADDDEDTNNNNSNNNNNNNIDHDDDDGSSSEHELTNLGWLIDLKNLAQWPVDSAHTANKKHSNGSSHTSLVNGIMNDIDDEENSMVPAISEKELSEERFKKFTIQVKQ